VNLAAYIENNNLDIPLSTKDNIQISDTQVIAIDDNLNIQTSSVGEALLVIVNDNVLTTLRILVKSPVKEIVLDDNDLTLLVGEIYPLNYTVVSEDDYFKSFNRQLRWTSSKHNIVGVKGSNKIYTYGVGTTTLTGTTFDGSKSITVNVKVIGNPDTLIVQPTIVKSTVNVGEERQLKAFFGTKDVTTNVEWESQYPEILTIDDNGVVRPLRAGTCEVTAQSSIDRRKDSYTFFVKSMVDKVTLDCHTITLATIGDQKQLNAQLSYADPEVAPLLDGYYYESSNDTIVSVTQDGLIKAEGPGIALISAIAYDSGKKDSCTVEVIGEAPPTTIDYTPVREISMSVDIDPMIIGQKVPLNYNIYPEEATDQSVKFDVRNGDVSQIQYIDGQYYFIPKERGTFRVKIRANGGIEDVSDEIEFSVKSPIASLNLSIGIERGTTNEKKLYVGEQTEVFTEILTQGYYSGFDVYPNTLEYSIDDPDILELEYLNGKYFITALERGSTYIRVKNIEDRHEESLRIKVLSPASKISTDREVRLPVNIYYAPSFDYTPTSVSKEAEIVQLESGIQLDVDEFYFAESYIDKEIEYETQIIDYFKAALSTPTTKSTITRHETRLERLNALKNSAVSGYCLVSTPFLKDRNFKSYKYYEIKDNQIIGYYPGKAKVSVSIDGSATNALTLIHWSDNKKDFAIKETTKWITYDNIISREGYANDFAALSNEDKIQYIIEYLNHKYRAESKPSIELLKALAALDHDKLPSSIVTDLDAITTRDELAYISIYLDKIFNGVRPLKTDNIIYYDVIKESVKQAIANGYVIPQSRDYLGVANEIDYTTFKSMVDRMYPVNNLPDALEGPFTHKQLILMLNQL